MTTATRNPQRRLARALLLVVFAAVGIVSTARAQSALMVPPGVGTLNDAIEGDANRPADRVYVLQRGTYYGITRELNNSLEGGGTFVLRIKAADGEGEIPVLYAAPDNTGSIPGNRYIRLVDDAYFTNVYLLGVGSNGGEKSIPVAVNGDGKRLVVEGSVMEGGSARFFEVNAADMRIIVRDSQFRNAIRTDGSSNGRFFDFRTVPVDTLIIENSTFLEISGYLVRYDGPVMRNFIFNHNTVYGTNRDLFTLALATQTINFKVANNLLVNVYRQGQAPVGSGAEPSGVVQVGFLDPAIENGYEESGRDVLLAHNDFFYTQPILDFYDTRSAAGDSIIAHQLFSAASRVYADSNATAVIRDNISDRVVFVDAPTDERFLTWFTMFRDQLPDAPSSAVGETVDLFPAELPLPENLAYATTDVAYTAAMGGFPLGDLNWFPDRKAAWLMAGGDQATPNEEVADMPEGFRLEGNFPNPFQTSTTLVLDLETPSLVTVEVFDVLGRRVMTLPPAQMASGAGQRLALDASDMPSGLYLYRVTAQSGQKSVVRTSTMTLLK